MGKLNDAVDEVGTVVERTSLRTRIGIVASIIWLIAIFIANMGDGYGSRFKTSDFLVLGLLPVVVYWGWRFIKAGRG